MRSKTGLFDLGHMGRIDVTGPDAVPFLDGLVTSFVAKIPEGAIRYGSSATRPAAPSTTCSSTRRTRTTSSSWPTPRTRRTSSPGWRSTRARATSRSSTARTSSRCSRSRGLVSQARAAAAGRGPRSLRGRLLQVPLRHRRGHPRRPREPHGLHRRGRLRDLLPRRGVRARVERRARGRRARGHRPHRARRPGHPAARGRHAPLRTRDRSRAQPDRGGPQLRRLLQGGEGRLDRPRRARGDQGEPRAATVGITTDGKRAAAGLPPLPRGRRGRRDLLRRGLPTLDTNIGTAYLPVELAQAGQTVHMDIRGKRQECVVCDLPFYSRKAK